MNRKEFFSTALMGGSILFLAPATFTSCSKSEDENQGEITVDLTSNNFVALQTVGGFAYVGNIIVIRTSTTNYVALSKICTHQSCTVAYSSSAGRIECPCHGSVYSTSGAVLQGPAPNPLKMYTVIMEGTVLKIS